MGVEYRIACRQCKVKRDLDKFYTADVYGLEVRTRADALKYAKERITEDAFRAGLLVSFMGKHIGHDCVLYNDLSYDPDTDDPAFAKDVDFWHESGGK